MPKPLKQEELEWLEEQQRRAHRECQGAESSAYTADEALAHYRRTGTMPRGTRAKYKKR